MTSVSGGSIQVGPASQLHIDNIIDFNIARALETEGKDLDPETVREGVLAVCNREGLGVYVIGGCSGRSSGGVVLAWAWGDWRGAGFGSRSTPAVRK